MARRPVALVFVHEPDGGSSLVGECLTERGYDVTEHLVTSDMSKPDDAAPFPSIDGADLLVAMGSTRSLTRTHEIGSWIFEELELVRTAHERGTPVLGICFGGQIISEALGGAVEEAPVTEIGWMEVHGPDNPIGPGPWLMWHHDRFEPPPGAEVLAATDDALQLFRIGRSVGTQFHPEVTGALVKAWVEMSDREYFDAHGVDPDELVSTSMAHEEHNRVQCRRLVDWFLDDVVG